MKSTISPDSTLRTRGRGRPSGSQAPLLAWRLERRHVHYLRARLEGLSRRAASARYLHGIEGAGAPGEMQALSPADERRLLAAVRQLAEAASIDAASIAALQQFDGDDSPSASSGTRPRPGGITGLAQLPPLDHWIEQQCREWEVDRDFMTESEWLHEYASAHGIGEFVDQQEAPRRASSTPVDTARSEHRRQQREALARLSDALDERLASEHLSAHLAPDLVDKLARTVVRQVATPLRTLPALRGFVASQGPRWWRHVPGLGVVRARRLSDWIRDNAASAGRRPSGAPQYPDDGLSTASTCPAPFPHLNLSMDRGIGPAEMRAADTTGWASGVEGWLLHRPRSTATCNSYRRCAELFWLWCTLVAGRQHPRELQRGDLARYADFLAAPPSSWVQTPGTRALRGTVAWRPLKGALAPASIALEVKVIAQMLGWWRARSWLPEVDIDVPAARVRRGPSVDVTRAYTGEQVAHLLGMWRQSYAAAVHRESTAPDLGKRAPDRRKPLGTASLRRTRLVLWMGLELGLCRREMLHAHLLDMAGDRACIEISGEAPRWVQVDAEVLACLTVPGREKTGDGGALPRWVLRRLDQPATDERRVLRTHTAPEKSPLSASALHGSFLRFLRSGQFTDGGRSTPEKEVLPAGSLHWLRHTSGLRCALAQPDRSAVGRHLRHRSAAPAACYVPAPTAPVLP